MGLVENYRIACRQEFRHALVAQHHIGEEQMMVHHHYIGFHCLLACFHDEAILVVRTVAAEAVLARRGHLRPYGRVFRHFRQAAAIPGLAGLGVGLDAREIDHVVAIQEAPVVLGALEVVMADIIGAALEQRHGDRRLQCVAHHGDVTIVELVLQRLGARRDNYLAALGQRRREVGKGLARAGARLGDEQSPGFDGMRDRQGHFQLLRAQTVAGNGAGQRAGIVEEVLQVCGQDRTHLNVSRRRRSMNPGNSRREDKNSNHETQLRTRTPMILVRPRAANHRKLTESMSVRDVRNRVPAHDAPRQIDGWRWHIAEF